MQRNESGTKATAARAVAHVLDTTEVIDAKAKAETPIGARRVRARPSNAAIDDDVVARLAAQAIGQQHVLLSRLVSHDPTKKARAHVAAASVGATNDARGHDDGEKPLPMACQLMMKKVDTSGVTQKRRGSRGLNAPISVDEFDQKYTTNDPILHYALEVIVNSKSVTRSEIPRRPERLSDATQRLTVPEEDVLFLAYHRYPPCGFRNVYWLELITEDRATDVELEYFALSHHGFTHYHGSSVVDFIDVDSWVMEKRAFDHMTAMRGLQKLQGLLFFMSWKKKAIKMKHRRVRDRLACSLFQCDQASARLLVAIRECCVKIEDLAASYPLPPRATYTLDYVRQLNRARLKSVRVKIIEQRDRMCQLIETESRSLQQQRDAEVEAERVNYANVTRSSRLLDRMYTFLRLIDLLRFESLSAHMNEFIADLHEQICGGDLMKTDLLHIPPGHVRGGETSSEPHDAASVIALPLSANFGESSPSVSFQIRFSLRHRAIPRPFVFGQVTDNVKFGSDTSDVLLDVSPTQVEVFDVLYGLLNAYVANLDEIPPLLSDSRFSWVMAPYTPQNREIFQATLLKPSSQALQERAKDLTQMKYAIETYYKQLEIQMSNLLRLLGDIQAAEDLEAEQKLSNQRSGEFGSIPLTAAQYEEVRGQWEHLLYQAQQLPRFVQIGVILLDQSSLLNRVEGYVTTHLHVMMEELPYLYKQFLCELLADADGRVEKIMNIPTSIPDAKQWLKEMMKMMPTHTFRKALATKCANLVRLKQLLKDSGAAFRSPEEQDAVKNLDYEWDSMCEMLITCFSRVQDRDSEHRRSVLELNGKIDDNTATQLDLIKRDYIQLLPHSDEVNLSKHKTRELTQKKQSLIDRLERLVAVDGEREEMVELYSQFEAEHRLLADNGFESPDVLHSSQKWVAKFPCELLLQHISVVFDVRAWFCAWIALEEKWIDTPLASMHSSMILSRLKQFRRRLQFASTRLLPRLPLSDEEEFVARDYGLVDDLEARVHLMSNDYVIIHAVTCGAFSNARWQLCHSSLKMESVDDKSVTLRMVRTGAESAPQAMEDFKEVCEIVIIESKLRNAAERLRQRMSACRVIVWVNASVVHLESVQDTVLDLDDIEVEATLLCQAQNPNIEITLTLCAEIQVRQRLCSQLLSFKGMWEELCLLSRVHDVDEFFTGQVAWKGPVQRQKKKVTQEESTWGDFVEVAQDWAERLRRLACISQSSATSVPTHHESPVDTSAPSKLTCSLEEVQEAFYGFDFEVSLAKCSLAHQLVDKYVAVVREKCPRLYYVTKQQLLQLMVHEEDACVIRASLSVCFPCVSSFKLTLSRRDEEGLLHENGLKLTKRSAAESIGSYTIKGITTGLIDQDFNVPVVKVGRLWFWLTRLEEEMSSLVTENAKLAVAAALGWAADTSAHMSETCYQDHLPQSIHVALSLLFTSTVESMLWHSGHEDTQTRSRGVDLVPASSRLWDVHSKRRNDVIEFASGARIHRRDARLESMILLLQYQSEVIERIHSSIRAGLIDDAWFVWETQFKIDFVIEDLSAKTARRIRTCDQRAWTDMGMLGPSFPVTFLATSGQSEFCLGRELTSAQRLPIVTPLTQRCFFEIMRALQGYALPLIAPINAEGRGGQCAFVKGLTQMLMKPHRELSCSPPTVNEILANSLKSVTSLGSYLVIRGIEQLETRAFRTLVEKINLLRQDLLHRFVQGHLPTPDCRATPSLPSTGCIFVPLDNYHKEGHNGARDILFGSTGDLFHPVTVLLPTVAHFTKTAALLAGYRLPELCSLKCVVTFFESLASLSPELEQKSSGIHRFICCIMQDISHFRGSCRVLLPSKARWSSKFTSAAARRSGPKRISQFFRRSADASDVSDVVIHTLFYHALSVRCIGWLTASGQSLPDQVLALMDQCFPSAQGCELTPRTTKTQEEAMWDALEMSLAQAGLIANSALIEKALELHDCLEDRRTVIVVGDPGVGKSTCIRTLHNALQALEVAEHSENSTPPSQRACEQQISNLVFMSSRFLPHSTEKQAERVNRLLGDLLGKDGTAIDCRTRRWLCIDGLIDSVRVERFIHEHFESESFEATHPSPRIILETTNLREASPAFLSRTRVLLVPSILTQQDLISCWRDTWIKRLPFPEGSRGFENVELVFRMTELFIRGPVRRFVMAEENTSDSATGASLATTEECSTLPSHLGMLSLPHLTLSCLQLITSMCFMHRSQLEARPAAQMTRLVAFCVIWGFTGHLSDVYRQKLDQLISPVFKQLAEVRHVSDPHEGLYESERLGSGFWNSVQLPLRGSEVVMKDQTNSAISRTIRDPMDPNRILVLSNAALPLVRVLRLLMHSTVSFLIVGERGCGKSSLLRLLWAMNTEDQDAETLIDASLDDRFAPNILNWQHKPKTWFDRPVVPPSATSQYRPKAHDEAQLFTSHGAGAAKFVFIDDLSMAQEPGFTVDPVDEFVRVALAHRMAINWTSDRVLPFSKAFGATITTRQDGTPKVRVPHHMERLLTHFSVFRMPHQDRQHLQGIFRQVYADWFVSLIPRNSGATDAPSRIIPSSDRVLSLPEVVLRASVDLAVDVLTVQHTTDKVELIEGFTFNLHHLNQLLSRSLSFCRLLATVNDSSLDVNGGATLLSLGKLHQCWVSSVRQVFLSPCSHRAPDPAAGDPSPAVVIDEVKKVVQSVKLTSEKYFSVPAREDPHAAMVTDIVYGIYRYLVGRSGTSSVGRDKLSQLLVANASASSTSTSRRNGICEGGGAAGSGLVMARDEFSVRVARDLILEHAADLLPPKSATPEPINLASRLDVRLHIGSSTGLHQLLHMLHAIDVSPGVLIDEPLSSIQHDVVRLAYAMERYELVELDGNLAASIGAQLEHALLSAGSRGKRMAVWIDLDELEDSQLIIETIVAACTGKTHPILEESEKLRNEAVDSCVQYQLQLQLLSSENAIVRFQDRLRQSLRLCVVAKQGTHPWLLEKMRSSAAFQWVSFDPGDTVNPRYRSEVVRQAVHELMGQTRPAATREQVIPTIEDTIQLTSWSTLHSLCDSVFKKETKRWREDTFLVFVANVVADCLRRVETNKHQVNERVQLLQALQEINDRVPRLQMQAQLHRARIHQLRAWHDELNQPLLDLRAQLRERVASMHEKEAEMTSDELRALQRRVQKVETQVWAHKSTMSEYDIAATEVTCQLREVVAQVEHWAKYSSVRESVEARSKTQLNLARDNDAPERMMRRSVQSNCLMLDSQCSRIESDDSDLITDAKPGLTGTTDAIVSQLWRARFPFLEHDDRAEQILSVVDRMHDRIPIVVDRSGLSQYVLVHIFSNVPWFADGNEDYDRRGAIGFTATGAVAPMVVQCDGTPKMWRKLHEAKQKEVPTLLVGVSPDLIEPLAQFARRYARGPRREVLAEMTHDAYRAQLKRDAHASKTPGLSGELASITSTQASGDRVNRRQGVVSADFKSVSAALVNSGVARRDSVDLTRTATMRRLSLSLGGGEKHSVAASKGLGFQLYAVTFHTIDRTISDVSGQFATFDMEWDRRSVESFFTESGVRRYDKKLFKDIMDTRRVEVDSAYRVAQAERVLWPIVRSPTCISPFEREEFMVRLKELEDEHERHLGRMRELPAQLACLASRMAEYDAIGRNVGLVARAVDMFARFVSPGSSMHLRSHRFFELLLDSTLVSLLKHDKQSRLQQTSHEWALEVSRHVFGQVAQAVLASLRSNSHQRILLMCLSSTASESPSQAHEARITWLGWAGYATWRRTDLFAQGVKKPTSCETEASGCGGKVREVETSCSSTTATQPVVASSGPSLVERLRRKVRVCSLMFEQVGGGHVQSTDPERQFGEESVSVSRSKKRGVKDQDNVHDNVVKPEDPSESLTGVHKTFRGIARVVKTLWCEWKLAKEDQHSDVRREIASFHGAHESLSVVANMRRRHHTVKDTTLASTNVTHIVTLADIVAQHVASEAMSDVTPRTLEGRLVSVMLAKVYFPQLFLDEWNACLATSAFSPLSTEVPTSQLLGIESPQRSGVLRDPSSDTASSQLPALQHLLPPSIDMAWRRDDLVHLPTRVLLYDPARDHLTIQVLLLRARESTQAHPLRLFSVVAWDECEARLEAQLTTAVTSKERFAIEISHHEHFNRVVALVSSIINQHALLCIPEWYVISPNRVFEQLQSPAMGFLRIHAVRKSAEPADLSYHLTRWLTQDAGLAESEAEPAARILLREASEEHSDGALRQPLSVRVQLLVTKLKKIAQSGDSATRQRQAKLLLLKELGLDTDERPTYRSSESRDVCVRRTKASMEFLGDLFLLPSRAPLMSAEQENTSMSGPRRLPPALHDLHAPLKVLCGALAAEKGVAHACDLDNSDTAAHFWRSLMTGECARTVDRTHALLQLLQLDTTANATRSHAHDRALVRQGLIPVNWLAQHFAELSDSCLANVVSIAQVLVLLVSRLGFLLHDLSGNVPVALNLSLLSDPRAMLRDLHERCASQAGHDPADMVFVLQPGVMQPEPSEASVTTAAVNSTGQLRRNSQQVSRGIDQLARQNSSTAAQNQAVATCIVLGDDGFPCGIQVEGLVAVERVTSRSGNGAGASQVFIHELPICRLVCQHRPVDTTNRPTTRDAMATTASSRQVTLENATTARLKLDGVRLTTIASTSAYQTLPDSLWVLPTRAETDPDTLLPRVLLASALLVCVPSLSRARSDQDNVSIVLAVPMFPTDDGDLDT